MRKTISLILTFILIAQIMCIAPISVGAQTGNSDTAKELYVLKYLGIVDIEETDDTTADITRVEFADYVAKALCLDTTGTDRFFADIPAQHWALGSVGALAKAGIINGTAGNEFEPDRAITYAEACKILVNIAGYGAFAEGTGGNLAEYVKYANRIGISITPEDTEALSIDEAVFMLYNTMAVPMAYEIGVKNGETEYKVNEDKTLFLIHHNVYIKEGCVETIWGKSLYNDEVYAEAEAIVGGEKYIVDNRCNLQNLFGRMCEYVYVKREADTEGVLIYAQSLYSKDLIEISAEQITGFEEGSNSIMYTEGDNGKILKKSVERSAIVVLNGRILKGELKEQIEMFANETRSGKVKLISSQNNSAVDIVVIESTRIYVIDSYHTDDMIIYGKYGEEAIRLNDYKWVTIRTPEGEASALPNTFPAPVGIAESDDGYAIDIVIYSNRKEVVIDSVISTDRVIVADGQRIKMCKTAYDKAESILKAGQMYRIVLDGIGQAVYIETLTDVMQIGYLRKTASVGGMFTKEFKFNIYTTDGSFKEYTLADKVKIDETNYNIEDYQKLFGAFPGNKTIEDDRIVLERQVIRYSLNADGEINKIDTYNFGVSEDMESTLERRADGTESLYHAKSPKKLGLTDLYDASTVVIAAPAVDENGKINFEGQSIADDIASYSIGVNNLVEYQSYEAETYYIGKSSPVAAAIVCLSVPSSTASEDVYMFDSISQGYDENDGVYNQINGWTKGMMVSHRLNDICLEQANALTRGDLYYLGLDYSGKAALKVIKMVDAEDKLFNSDPASREVSSNDGSGGLNKYWWVGNIANAREWRIATRQLIKMYPLEIISGYVKGGYTMENVRRGGVDDVLNIGALPVTVFDSQNSRTPIYKGTLADIQPYKYSGEDCSMVVVHTRYQDLKNVFVYR